jgi:predicted PurR-regulated permease PerM/GAF domain-containing protein
MAGIDPIPPPQLVSPVGHSLITAGGILLAIGGLYLGREFFIPFTLAILLAFALSPIVNAFRRWRVPRIPAVIVAVTLAFILIGVVSYVVAAQVVKLADEVPSYRQTMVEKIKSLRGSGATEGGVVDRIMSTIEGLGKELTGPDAATDPLASPPAGTAMSRQPVPVTIEPRARSPLDVIGGLLGPLVESLAIAGIVIVFVIFVLLEREDLKDRFIKLVGAGDLQTSTEALNEAGDRVSRYLLMQLLVNVTYGLPIGVGLYFIGVPNAVLWGVLAVVLRFIPYLGPFLAALFPMALAFAVDPGWSMLLWVIGLFLFMELLSNNIVEPWLYGSSTGLSSLAIISAAIFWASLWGPIGLVLSTPLTVCLIVIGRYVPQLQFLGVLLGSDPVLAPEEQLYQRLLAGNTEEAIEIAENYTDEHSSREFYDQVAIPALRLAENDRQRSTGDASHKRRVAEGMAAVVQEVADHARQQIVAEKVDASNRATSVPRVLGVPDLCIAGRTDLDAAAAEMVAQAVAERGIGARVLPPIAISQNGIGQLDLAGVEVVCLSYLAPEPRTFATFACRRLKRRALKIKTIVCLWNPSAALMKRTDLREYLAADAVVFSVEAAAAQIDAWVSPHISDPMQPAPVPENEQGRIAALRSLDLLTGESKHFDEVAAKVAAAFVTPIALVTLVDEDHQRWPGAVGLPPRLDACRMDARETSICGHVVFHNDVLVVEDVAKDPRFANNPFLIENGIRFYAGVPLKTSSGVAIGSLCVIDTKPRSFSDHDCKVLWKIADDLMVKVEIEFQRDRTQGSSGSRMAKAFQRE